VGVGHIIEDVLNEDHYLNDFYQHVNTLFLVKIVFI